MDAIQAIVSSADEATAVLGRGEDYMLIPLGERGPMLQAILDDGKRRGFRFVGVLAIVNGRAAAKCEVEDADAVGVMMLAAVGFAQQSAETLRPKDEGAAWLERLYRLPDTRDSK